ncbi:glutathione S-transferase family protein [Pseudorhodoplanes sinuspersici]|uniref:Glutathione S-transferase n=1 Tax=Pseudorhodoplanes sinuspersici TaxID=1235591 RepID=A0A1W6ZMD1_9HYPH|nr:glutathione S-transferase family protein [Pseudorhodoplanes sinuspersici]ARP98558.1 glutathione S-transferase [Pseudorhodoplanes sinuspersici]RKE69869.1 glutathione S-transferase [Pseudorhodoplanes sinuspersici]
MLTLFHHPFCPHSRFIRLALGEYAVEPALAEERAWERREEFLLLNPAGQTPVMVAEGYPPIPGASVIAEYLAEQYGPTEDGTGRDLLGKRISERIEVRRLLAWFNEKFFTEVSNPLVTERVYKRHMREQQGGGPPDTDIMRAARRNIRYHLAYVGWLAGQRDWLAGDNLSYADLAAAAQLSVIDYLGDVPWSENDHAKNWYARVKSRPSFRPLLAETSAALPPAPHYADLDF